MRRLVLSAIVGAGRCLCASAAHAEGLGVEIAAGPGVTIPFGALTSPSTVAALGYAFAPGVPLGVDAGLRFGPVYFGASFQYLFLLGCCGANDIQATGEGRFYLHPQAKWSPWLGAGLGVETANAGSNSYGGYSADVRVGVDFRSNPADVVRFGPFASVSVGEFTCDPEQPGSCGLHGWASIGLRGVLDAVR